MKRVSFYGWLLRIWAAWAVLLLGAMLIRHLVDLPQSLFGVLGVCTGLGFFLFFPYSFLVIVVTVIGSVWPSRRAWLELVNPVCPTCGYDLRATPDRCPECGNPVPSPGTPGEG